MFKNIAIKFKLYNEYHNPFYYWWKVRKIFKRPKCHVSIGKYIWFFGLPCRKEYYNRFLSINISNLGWKSKYDSPRHEWDPYIDICFFRTYHITFIFNYCNKNDIKSNTKNIATWESILDYLYFNKSIEWCINNHVWNSYNKDQTEKITICDNIKSSYLNKILNEQRN